MNTGLVSIDLAGVQQLTGLEALRATGNNSGNLLFTYAVSTQVRNPACVGFNFLRALREGDHPYSSLVLPAANWVIRQPDFGFLADQLEQVSQPICCVGLGAQISPEEISDIPPGTRRFLQVLGSKSPLIGLRGESTERILRSLGVTNTLVCGCPSLFPDFLLPPVPYPIEITNTSRLSISFTRYGQRPYSSDDAQDRIARLAARLADWIILQSEAPEIEFLESPNQETSDWLGEYYGVVASEIPSLAAKMRFFTTQPAWVNFIRQNVDVTISSRIHGCIASLLAGKPALLLTHDARTRELGEVVGIPRMPAEEVAVLDSKADLIGVLNAVNWDEFADCSKSNRDRLLKVYESCGVAVNCPVTTASHE